MTENLQSIDSKVYHQHLEEVSRICDSSRLTLVQMYWNIGNYITEISVKNAGNTGYGTMVLKRLSEDLTRKYGKGYSGTNLKNMRSFHRAYNIENISPEIEWTSYVLLLTVKDPEKREELENRIINESLSPFRLRQELTELRIKESLALNREYTPPQINCIRGRLYTYAPAKNTKQPQSENEITIDCGFNIIRRIKTKDTSWAENTPLLLSVKKRDTYTFIQSGGAENTDLYTYTAYIEKIIDGDTILALIDCGFSTTIKMRLRLKGIDAPEIDTPEGVKALEFVKKALKDSPVIGIKTYKADKYSRYLADIFYLPHESNPEKIITEGIYLNQQLLDKGLAIKS